MLRPPSEFPALPRSTRVQANFDNSLQETANYFGARVEASDHREYGEAIIKVEVQPESAPKHLNKLFEGIPIESPVSSTFSSASSKSCWLTSFLVSKGLDVSLWSTTLPPRRFHHHRNYRIRSFRCYRSQREANLRYPIPPWGYAFIERKGCIEEIHLEHLRL